VAQGHDGVGEMNVRLRDRIRVAAGVWVLTLAAVLSFAQIFRDVVVRHFYWRTAGGDNVELSEERFAVVRRELAGRAIVGYLSDRPPGTGDWTEGHQMAQYALVPTLVVAGADHETILGDFDDPEEGLRLAREAGLKLVNDCGRGIMLLTSEGAVP
jgi:hypothetical protein